MPIVHLINSFNAGELSPLVSARVDLEKYRSGCQTLQNFIILPYGGAVRRPGTQYLGRPKRNDARCRLVGFNFSTTTNFILELGAGYIRFWSNGQQVHKSTADAWSAAKAYSQGDYVLNTSLYYCAEAHTSTTWAADLSAGKWVQQSLLEVPTPYAEAELREIQFVQVNDLMYLVHPSHEPLRLSRLANDNWTCQPIPWTWPAFLDENTEETTITPSGISGTITLTASAPTFSADMAGAYFSIAHRRNTSYIERVLSATGSSTGLDVLGDWELTTYGRWDGRLRVQRSYDGTTWETLRTYESSTVGERNVNTTGTEEKQCQLRLDYTADAAGDTNPNARLECQDNRVYGVVKITGTTSPTVATATVVKPIFAATATKIWAEGAFSTHRGYPRTVALHEQRLIFGGTRHRPLSVWGSVVDDFENFRYTPNDDGAFLFTISANESNPIQWLVSKSALLIGTAGDEWTLGASDSEQVLSPTNVRAKRQSSYGSKYLQARIVNEVIIFCQRQGRKVRELTYAYEKDGWVAPDLTILAEHISQGEFVETAFQQQPDAIFWAITGAGKLVGMTYERDQNVVGWHSHSTQGEFESVATIYGGSGADEVWFSVRRVVNGETVRCIERMKSDFRQVLEDEAKPDWWYLDCARQYALDPSGDTVADLHHLEGLEVGVLSDGAVQPSRTVTSGGVTLQAPGSKILIGLPYESILRPMKLDIQMQDGTAQGRKARIHRAVLRLYKSLGGEYSADGQEWNAVYFRQAANPMDTSPPAFTGDKEIHTGGGWSQSAELWIRQTAPLPLCVLALIPKWDASGD